MRLASAIPLERQNKQHKKHKHTVLEECWSKKKICKSFTGYQTFIATFSFFFLIEKWYCHLLEKESSEFS